MLIVDSKGDTILPIGVLLLFSSNFQVIDGLPVLLLLIGVKE